MENVLCFLLDTKPPPLSTQIFERSRSRWKAPEKLFSDTFFNNLVRISPDRNALLPRWFIISEIEKQSAVPESSDCRR